LSVAWPGSAPHEFKELAGLSPKFKALTWIGFSSPANAKTVYYLDDFMVDAEPAARP
jgi:hypothetical protein